MCIYKTYIQMKLLLVNGLIGTRYDLAMIIRATTIPLV